MERSYCVYIITNKYNTVLYTGVTSNLVRRMNEHKNKLIKGFSAKYNLDKLVFYDCVPDINEAIAAEKRIKGWVKKKKISLIEEMNPVWIDLSEEWFKDSGDPSLRSPL